MHKASYEVRFFRHLVNGSGKPYRSCLTTLNIRRCGNPRQAAKVAIKKFERQWALHEWKSLAHEIEVAEISPADTPVYASSVDGGMYRGSDISSAGRALP
ncbi:MAG: hypothetical protein RBS99_11315 [Rhodospirillales bacterium]|nr:hypothetical protein [Rhodospirillales bacterium]